MLIRAGCDLVEIKHFRERFEFSGKLLLDRIFDDEEQELLAGKIDSMAGFYALKEAFAKALGLGLAGEGRVRFSDIMIRKTKKGAPYVLWSDRLAAMIPQVSFVDRQGRETESGFLLDSATVSISHDGGYAMAFVVLSLLKEEEGYGQREEG